VATTAVANGSTRACPTLGNMLPGQSKNPARVSYLLRYCAALYQCDKFSGMRTVSRAWTAIATATVFAMLLASFPARVEATPDEPRL